MKLQILKAKSIQGKFLITIIPLITLILSVLAYSLYFQERDTQVDDINGFSLQIAKARSNEIEKWLNSLVFELQGIARRDIVETMDWNVMQKEIKNIADIRKDTYGFFTLSSKEGDFYFTTIKDKSDQSIKNQQVFNDIIELGKDYSISNPYLSLTTNEPIFMINVPVKANDGEIIGTFGGIVYLSTLSKIAGNIKIGENGYGWIMDNEGLIFAHPNENYVLDFNIIESKEAGYKNLDILGKQMLNTNSGTGFVTNPQNTDEYIIYYKIPSSPNWTLGITVPNEQVFANIYFLMFYLVISFLLTIVSIILLIWILTNKIISNPISKLTALVKSISQGNLFNKVDINSHDEVGEMADSLRTMSEELRGIVSKIRESSDSIATGSNQISNSASQIAEGAGEQAASTEEVSASMEEMVASINQNSDNARQTEQTAKKASNDITKVKNSVEVTIKAITTIAEKISVITDIAEKTDLLAINAAVEAARAGEHGKGFAVVASEVRKLAENSQKAALEINSLSAETVNIAQKSGVLLNEIVPVINNNADLVREITAASIEQNSGATQVNNAVQQLTQVTQENSAAAEQMATGSEELSQQAEILKEIISFFKINKEEVHTNITDIAYKQLVETINLLQKDKTNLENKKIEIDLSNVDIEKLSSKSDVSIADKGVKINLKEKDDSDDQFEKIS